MERRNFIKSSLGIGLGATLPGMTHSKSGKEAETAVSPAMPVKSGKMHWFPQKALHGFHATLIDESGRVESPDFISDYREWFQLQAPGKDPDLTGIGWNDHAARCL